ncbi:lipocalin family protein [Massilia sp. R2A-15]|uniref:lipocalin family protein n=1 Tax=Massilia sp. R2A-15 TaxID=3064278 RepID=UPI0027332CB5|nr:lipocalin family protein [Massilia sp. R2A-15]WLI90734.1 lipocalin family protein [Massilia sp. R2A-15]
MTALLLLGLSWNALAADVAPAGARPLSTIASLDVPRYMGTWYEIAKFPNRFQKKCVGFTSATYSALADGTLQVRNRCRMDNGQFDEAVGAARQVGGPDSPRLKVRFAPAFLSFLPMVWGDYWVIDLDAGYQLAAVSEQKREFLWILSRTPKVDPARYRALVARLEAQGFDVSKLVPTRQE